MTEPDVALTDYGLTFLCTWFAWTLWRQPTQHRLIRNLWIGFFVSAAVGAFAGGTVHGFFLDPSTWGYQLLWPATLLCIGVTAAACWMLTGALVSPSSWMKGWIAFAALSFAAYSVVVLFVSQNFLVVILNYLPAMVALLIASLWRYRQSHTLGFLFVGGGIGVSFVAAAIQQAGISLHPLYFNHNSTFHLVQAVGLWLMFRGASDLLKAERIAV